MNTEITITVDCSNSPCLQKEAAYMIF